MRSRSMSRTDVLLCLLVAVFLRWAVSLHPYSGQGKPPMFGDYEAQRHWMEITLNLPANEWYHNTTENDLLYWGLDYPPLTAYHSLVMAKIANKINASYVLLDISRGHESYSHKLFMRATVLISDLFIYMPAVFYYFSGISALVANQRTRKSGDGAESNTKVTPILGMYLCLIFPGLILIDHGHFQYNGVSLGLMVFAVGALLRRQHFRATLLFTLAVNYKQMELYHALPFFFYLLSMCTPRQNEGSILKSITKLVSIGCVVVLTFLIIWFPFLYSWESVFQVVHRLFPVARGVFEDKVANVWCALNIVYKLRNAFLTTAMVKLCLVLTSLAAAPSCVNLFLHPSLTKFLLCLINSSLAFFLFSYQVHEKSILLVAVPVCLYLPLDPIPCCWFLAVATFSLLPLMLKDQLIIAYLAMFVFYIVTVHLAVEMDWHTTGETAKSQVSAKCQETQTLFGSSQFWMHGFSRLWVFLYWASILTCVLISIITLILEPPEKYPDLFSLLTAVYSCMHFVCFFVYFNYRQLFTISRKEKTV